MCIFLHGLAAELSAACVDVDGMGGPGGGKLAGELAVEAFLSSCLANLRAGMDPAQVQEGGVVLGHPADGRLPLPADEPTGW